jgi:hypothetical protein
MRSNLLFVVLLLSIGVSAQTVTNGTFTSASAGWGCSPETNPVSVYGGSGSDRVAEVDTQAGLCQTISGFDVGTDYKISFDCSRRTTCGPAAQTLDFYIDGGALATHSISRTGSFNFTQESFVFTAINSSHTIDFDGTSAGTCGLIIDNIEIALASFLPIELMFFQASVLGDDRVRLDWQTATEINNDFFSVERSKRGIEWEVIGLVDGAGESGTSIDYTAVDYSPEYGSSYYRLKQTDYNGQFSYSDVAHVNLQLPTGAHIVLFPNPSNDLITIEGKELFIDHIAIYNGEGQDVTRLAKLEMHSEDREWVSINLSELPAGRYLIKTNNGTSQVVKH